MTKIVLKQEHRIVDKFPHNDIILIVSNATRGESEFWYNSLMNFVNESDEKKKEYFRKKEHP